MMTRKPKQFRIVTEDGRHVGFTNPATGAPWYRSSWPAIKTGMAGMAADLDMSITIVNDRCGNYLTVTPEGEWK